MIHLYPIHPTYTNKGIYQHTQSGNHQVPRSEQHIQQISNPQNQSSVHLVYEGLPETDGTQRNYQFWARLKVFSMYNFGFESNGDCN